MILVLGAVVALVTVPLTGGSLAQIGRNRLRGASWMVGAIVVQQVIPALHDGWLPRSLHLASFGLAAVFIVVNRDRPGLRLVAAGGFLNVIAIATNRGVMPASPEAWRSSGAPRLSATWFANARPIAHARLAWLGDVIRFPSQIPGSAPFSVGDVLIVLGLILLVHHLSGAPWATRDGDPPLRVRPSGPVTSTTKSVQSITERRIP